MHKIKTEKLLQLARTHRILIVIGVGAALVLWYGISVVTTRIYLSSTIGQYASQTIHSTPKVAKLKRRPSTALPTTNPSGPVPKPVAPPAPVAPSSVSTPKSTPSPAPVANTSKPTVAVVPAPSSSVSTLTPSTTSTSTTSTSPSSSATSTSSSPPPPQQYSYTSSNWAGYLVTNGKATAISATWTVPQSSGNGSTTTADATWIGIGGVTTSDLIQVGTQNSVSPTGTLISSAFYELLPQPSQQITNLNVSAGDSITASLVETSTNQWLITITDNTKNKTLSSSLTYTSSNSSAEWIEEDPSYISGQQIPLDNFGTVSFSSSSTTINGTIEGIQAANADSVTMINANNQDIATPSAVGADGASFSVTRENFN